MSKSTHVVREGCIIEARGTREQESPSRLESLKTIRPLLGSSCQLLISQVASPPSMGDTTAVVAVWQRCIDRWVVVGAWMERWAAAGDGGRNRATTTAVSCPDWDESKRAPATRGLKTWLGGLCPL
eukprot:GHVU01217170.1.p1 GENE.GHVU01217170.1~~GHVU01217170.1.p1  ORF type:complete len:126 (-),score=7.29 GHVU01217170.1:1448-1825(-)